ncbi:tRNA (adenosine(37)-N6)-threonylcarbamoyltransferase complex dimerization subunit type 1 TsaB [Oharaeibacter diazotrophicus]|uniref:tRNA threonylcarbamoyladenosine biosynthesis protein TsaB n=1 Tax=Oharaeibacter diazotrophicus TaxID=1920512 RepID=A0A4R6R7H0_9HYPH|nr:tRNA (adenosine(37)-N6)-threonylcarbamoyltransferase complex dimerization subunit type 1 TsaB [Oharaeibacter diazotrophicus]TDP81516.1 tRNA threonylcarbamoyladenosine biosynthesis protein TsaB [Oharaeibacter diazotrophicus]BBE73754.1 tRNA threonylcarbamoyladenosine biosynthesis protein TsaB [Pleomorphomonas sp. SM30]
MRKTMIVLAFDTAHDRTAVALVGPRLDAVRVETMERGHAERLLPLVDAVLAEAGVALADVDRFAVTVGPGSFTGIRVGVAAARGLALATGRPAVGIGSLPALAASLPEPAEGPVLATVDARRGEVYAALYAADGREIEPPFAAEAADVLARIAGRATAIVGSGAPILAHAAATAGLVVPPSFPLGGPDPRAVARLAGRLAAPFAPVVPLYVRPPDAKPQAALVEVAR